MEDGQKPSKLEDPSHPILSTFLVVTAFALTTWKPNVGWLITQQWNYMPHFYKIAYQQKKIYQAAY